MKQLNETELQRRQEQRRLEHLVDNKERNRLGQFATPPSLAVAIMQAIWQKWQERQEKIRFLEPALGTGAFYAALRQVFPNHLLEEAVGIEADGALAQAAVSLWKPFGLKVREGDFTHQEPPAREKRFNLLVTNPPYVRHHHLLPDEKTRMGLRVFRNLGIKVSGLAGLYCYFLLFADQWLAHNALCAWLIPAEFMDVNYGTALKRYLTRDVSLLQIHRFCPADVQFDDALVSSAVVIFANTTPAADHRICFSYGGSLLEPQVSREIPLRLAGASTKWGQFALGGNPAAKKSTTLGDWFAIKRGLATGANQFFILEIEEAHRLGIPPEFRKPILPSPRQLFRTVIERDENGYPKLDVQLCLIDCPLDQDEVKKSYPAFWQYLEKGRAQKLDEGYLTSRRFPWYSQEKRAPAPFLCTYMGRCHDGQVPVRFIWNKSEAIAHNVYLLLYPLDHLKTALAANPALYQEIFAALSSIDANHIVRESRVYGGGLYKLEPKELAAVPADSVVQVLQKAGLGTQTLY